MANMSSYVTEIRAVSPHAKSCVAGSSLPPFFRRLFAGGHQYGTRFATIENSHPLMTVEGAKNLRHTAAKIKDSGLHDISPVNTQSVQMKVATQATRNRLI
jgi:hypothetical protein